MHVVHVVQRYPPALGGSEAYFARLSRYLVAQGEQVTVWTTTGLALEAFWDRRGACVEAGTSMVEGVSVRRFPLVRLPAQRWLLKPLSLLPVRPWQCLTQWFSPLSPALWLAAERYDGPCDLVHATAFPYSWPLFCAWRLAHRRGVPFVLTPFVHTGDPLDPHDAMRRGYTRPHLLALARRAQRILVQTEVERDCLLQNGFPPEKLVLQGMGIDAEQVTGGDRQGQRRIWRVADDEMLVGHLANKSPFKGTIDLLQAAAQGWAQGGRFRLVLAGEEMPAFRSFWASYPHQARVLNLGVLTEAEKRDFLAAVDVLALPSRSDSFGLVLLEAWANGAATIGYRAGGVASVIRHEEDGLLVRCGAVDALAQALLRLEREPEWRRQLGECGRKKTLQSHRWDNKLALVHRLYGELLGAPGLRG